MKTLIKITIVASILCCIGSVFALDYVAYERTQPITIDGVINAGEWNQAVHHVMKYPDIINDPYNGSMPLDPAFPGFFAPVNDADLSADVYASWDSDSFYFAVRVYDDTMSFTGNPANVDDEVQFLFNPGLGTGDYRNLGGKGTIFQVAPDGSGGTYVYSRMAGFNEPNAVTVSTVLSDGYVIEFKYPWKNCMAFAKDSPNYGDVIRVSWILVDDVLTLSKTLMCDSSGPNRTWDMNKVETWNNFKMVSPTGCGINGIMAGDINLDCVVGMDDFAMLLDQWLDCSDPQTAGCVEM